MPDGLPYCLIVDLQMPEMSGFELQQHLTRRGVQIPTIVITAHGDVAARERCKSAGVIAFLLKPLQDTSLFAAIAAADKSQEAGSENDLVPHWPKGQSTRPIISI